MDSVPEEIQGSAAVAKQLYYKYLYQDFQLLFVFVFLFTLQKIVIFSDIYYYYYFISVDYLLRIFTMITEWK